MEESQTPQDVSEVGSEESSEGPQHHDLQVVVFAPNQPDPKHFTFPPSEIVGTAAQVAAVAFGYAVGNPSFQVEGGSVLDRTVSLSVANVHNGAKLELVDAGGGV